MKQYVIDAKKTILLVRPISWPNQILTGHHFPRSLSGLVLINLKSPLWEVALLHSPYNCLCDASAKLLTIFQVHQSIEYGVELAPGKKNVVFNGIARRLCPSFVHVAVTRGGISRKRKVMGEKLYIPWELFPELFWFHQNMFRPTIKVQYSMLIDKVSDRSFKLMFQTRRPSLHSFSPMMLYFTRSIELLTSVVCARLYRTSKKVCRTLCSATSANIEIY